MYGDLKKIESGRSMVEMLGVLAIIGVFSVAGIAGYSSAMKRHRANELLNEVSKRAAVVAAQLLIRDTANLSEFDGQNVSGGTFTNGTITPSNGQFMIEITGVDDDVCNQIKNMAGGAIQGISPATCSGNNNTVQLTFNNDLSTNKIVNAGYVEAELGEPCIENGFQCNTISHDCLECQNGVWQEGGAAMYSPKEGTECSLNGEKSCDAHSSIDMQFVCHNHQWRVIKEGCSEENDSTETPELSSSSSSGNGETPETSSSSSSGNGETPETSSSSSSGDGETPETSSSSSSGDGETPL